MRKIKKIAVLGSGVMGAGISCHLANAGFDVVMLDMIPKIPEGSTGQQVNRNAIAEKALAQALKSKPAALYHAGFTSRITTGNLEDHLPLIEHCDWIIEVVIEQADIKKGLYGKIEKYRREGTLISTNTSGIPVGMLAEGRSSDFQKHFCGTHFFNPARYMALLEIIPHKGTDAGVIDFFMQFGQDFLGKRTVLCKDTPAFIANRIGFYSGNKVAELTEHYQLSVEDVDKLTGETIGWPNTGSYRLLDLVGIDTSVKVTKGVIANCPDDEYVRILKDKPVSKVLEYLVQNSYLGDKSGQGFYKKTEERDAQGKRVILAIDLNTLEYKPVQKSMLTAVGIAKKVEIMPRRLQEIFNLEDSSGRFVKELLCGIMAYAANRIPEITEHIYSIDDAMKSGYAWGYGPFEYWDMLGIKEGAAYIRSSGEKIPVWVESMIKEGINSFYRVHQGRKEYYNIHTKTYLPLPYGKNIIYLDNLRTQTPVYKNAECILHDLGDGVLCLEFTSKSNAIGEGIGMGVVEALRLAEEGSWKGLVIGNNAKNFTVGANLMVVGMLAMQKEYAKLAEMVDGFQQVNMAMRYARIPVVTATQGYVFGGGCEMLMHTDAAICHAESYIGLVEVGVGLIPGGGGTKEMALRAAEQYLDGEIWIPEILHKLKVIATATVATSAYEAFDHGYLLRDRDTVEINLSQVLAKAKDKVLQLSERYIAPSPKEVMVLGRNALGTLYTGINEFYRGQYMSEYDVEISRKIAYVLCGGDLTSPQKVSEQYLLDIEREAFLQLLGNQKTIDRIQYLLMNNKPLRN